MPFTFAVKTEEELSKVGLLDPGIYDFEVLSADQGYSQAGNSQVKMVLDVWDRKGVNHTIYDYLVNTDRMLYKIRHFCLAVGLDYESGKFDAADCVGKIGKVEICIQEGKPNPQGGMYPSRNAVRDYVQVDPNAVEKLKNGKPVNDLNDDIPF